MPDDDCSTKYIKDAVAVYRAQHPDSDVVINRRYYLPGVSRIIASGGSA